MILDNLLEMIKKYYKILKQYMCKANVKKLINLNVNNLF